MSRWQDWKKRVGLWFHRLLIKCGLLPSDPTKSEEDEEDP